jgi:hypothetical protein
MPAKALNRSDHMDGIPPSQATGSRLTSAGDGCISRLAQRMPATPGGNIANGHSVAT